MTIERQTLPYEVLVRLGPDGFVAAHVCDLERFVDTETDEVVAERTTPARGVTKAEAGKYLGAANAQLVEQLQGHRAEVQALQQELADAKAERDDLKLRVADRERRLAIILGALKD